MQVIIKKTGELKQVSDGYARNYLLPKQLATAATTTAVEQAKTTQALRAADQQARQTEYATLNRTLSTTTLQLAATANDKGKLFAAVHLAEVVKAFQDKQLPITDEMISLPAIKQTGDYNLTVHIPGQAATTVALTVTAA